MVREPEKSLKMSSKVPSWTMRALGKRARSGTWLLNVWAIIKIDCNKLLLPELFRPARIVTGANFNSPELTIGLKFSIDQLLSILLSLWLFESWSIENFKPIV